MVVYWCMVSLRLILVFFFQAEDGIRDGTVTGVQTCALPICLRMRFAAWLVLFATLLLWSGNWIVARAAREEIGPALATVGRLILVLAILLPFTFRGLTGKLPVLRRRDWI